MSISGKIGQLVLKAIHKHAEEEALQQEPEPQQPAKKANTIRLLNGQEIEIR